jgi:WD40 repeat protein
VTSIAIDPLTRVAVTGDYAGVLRLWDVETGDMLQLFTGHRSAIKDILLTDYASLALVLHDDGAVRTWTLRRRPVSYEEERNPFIPASALVGGREAVTRVALSRDGRLAVTASDDYAVRLWQPDTGALESVLRGHEGSVTDIALTPDSATAVSAGSDGTVRAWVAQPRASLFNLREFTPKRIGNGFIRFAPSWPFLLAVWDDSVIYWNTTSLQGAIVMDLNAIEEVAVSPDGKLAALGYENGSITVWEVAHGELKWESPGYPENSGSGVEGHGSAISSVTFSNDGGRLLTAEHGGSARVWDVGSGVSLVTLPHTCRHAPRFVDDGRTIATVRDTQLVLWDAMSFDIQSAVEIGTKIFGYGISKDGRHAAVSFYNDGAQMQLWDLIGKRKVSELQPHASVIWSLEFSPTGGRFLSRSDDATAKLWSSDGELIRVYGRPRGGRWVYDSVFSPSGRIFALGFDNGVVELYSAADGTHIVTLDAKDLVILDPTDVQRMRRMTARNSPPRIVDLEFSLDGKWLAALTRDGYVRLWPAFPRVGDAVAHAKRALRTYSRGLD